jgi:CRISPR/Cas system-associated endonuclease Cas1
MQYKDLSEIFKKQIIDDYVINKLTKKQIREKYNIGQKLCSKILKDIPLNRLL